MTDLSRDVTAFILAGGNSTRMGSDKAFLILDGRTLLTRAVDLASLITPEVRIVGDPAKYSRFAPAIEDIFPHCGPLGGIHAALKSSQTDYNLILAVDVPFVSVGFLNFLIARSRKSGATVTVVRTGGGWQPLCAVYRRTFADQAEAALRRRQHKIDALFPDVAMCVISESELKEAGFSTDVFRNLNSPQDVAGAMGQHS